MVSVVGIAKNISETDEILNQTIQSFLDSAFYQGPPTTFAQWRIDNYAILRKWSYPEIGELADAQLKIRNNEPEGETQLADYDAVCWAVKLRFPKENTN